MVRNADINSSVLIGAQAIAIGMLANTALKLLIGAIVGTGEFRRLIVVGLFAIALAFLLSLRWMH